MVGPCRPLVLRRRPPCWIGFQAVCKIGEFHGNWELYEACSMLMSILCNFHCRLDKFELVRHL